MFRCNIQVDDVDLFVRILLKRLKLSNEMVFLLDPDGREVKSVSQLKRLPYFLLSDRHINWSFVDTPLINYIKL
jgi:hypothetical protein